MSDSQGARVARTRSRFARALRWAWVVPLVAASAVLFSALERRVEPHNGAPPAIASPDEIVPGFGARVAVSGGALEVRVAPLGPVPSRERFAARELAARLALGDGEPWRATLTFSGDASLPALELGELACVDGDGTALAVLAPPVPRADAPTDPVRTLYAARPSQLEVGRSVDVVLWGRAPRGAVRCVGIGAEPIALAGEIYRRVDLEQPLARLEVARKKNADGSSAVEPSATTSR